MRFGRYLLAAAVFASIISGCEFSRRERARAIRVGATAPELAGDDLDGRPMKLSDYRGKVVLLDFWGRYCSGCRALARLERSLVQQYRNRPFVVLAVNTDVRIADARDAMREEGATWRSWWDPHGEKGYAYHTPGYIPAIYLIDAEGKLRFLPPADLGPDDINNLLRQIEYLVRAAEGGRIAQGPWKRRPAICTSD